MTIAVPIIHELSREEATLFEMDVRHDCLPITFYVHPFGSGYSVMANVPSDRDWVEEQYIQTIANLIIYAKGFAGGMRATKHAV